jgi:hypothetical protein
MSTQELDLWRGMIYEVESISLCLSDPIVSSVEAAFSVLETAGVRG